MAIGYSDFFTKAGKAFHAANTAITAAGTTIPDESEDFVQQFGSSDSIELHEAIEGVNAVTTAFQSTAQSFINVVARRAIQSLLVQVVKADNPQLDESPSVALAELIKQMEADSESLDASTPSVTPSYGGSNVGDGTIVTSVLRPDGKTNEFIFAEDIEGEVTAITSAGLATVRLSGELFVDPTAYDFPAGSGTQTSITSHTAASSENRIANGGFETANASEEDLPDGWIASVGTLGTTIILSPVEVQTVVVSGTPTTGYYLITYTDRNSKVQTTAPLAYNANEATVQTALRALSGLEAVTVATTGTTPNFTHTITFTGVPNPGQLTSTVSFERNEQQTVTITGTPTGGTFTLTFDGQTTSAINHNANAATVESAIEALSNVTAATVTGGPGPGTPWVVEFVTPGLQDVAEMTATSSLTGGSTPEIAVTTTTGGRGIVHATSTAGSANVVRGARSLEIDSDGSELTTLNVPVSLLPKTQYAFSLLAKTDSAPAAGVLTVDLVDGIGGTVIADDESVNNAFTIDATALTTSWVAKQNVFRTPTAMPDTVYLRIRVSTAISNTSSVYLDEAVMVPMRELYAGGLWVAVFTGNTAWEVGDTLKLPVANDQAGALHEWMDRVFDLRQNRLLLPTDSSGSETIADSLIA